MARILVDADMPRPTQEVLARLGIVAEDVRDIGLGTAFDEEIFRYAQQHDQIIVSRDLGFANISEYPLGTHRGIVVFRLPPFFVRTQILKAVEHFFGQITLESLVGTLTIVEPGRYRIRR